MKALLRSFWNRWILGRRFVPLRPNCTYPIIGFSAHLTGCEKITVGSDVMIGRRASILVEDEGSLHMGDRVVIGTMARLVAREGMIELGNGVHVNEFCSLYGHAGGLKIGNDVLIAAGCRLIPGNHTFDRPDLPIAKQPSRSKGIVIEDGVWLGSNVVVVDGVRIGEGAVIGAGAVVSRDIPPYAIAVGVPARVVKMRPGHEIRKPD